METIWYYVAWAHYCESWYFVLVGLSYIRYLGKAL